MALLIPGHWPSTAFPDGHWEPNHWPHYGTGAGGPSLIAGHWADNAFPDGHYDPNHWLHWGAGVGGPSLIPGHWADNAFPDGHYDPNHWLHWGPGPEPVIPPTGRRVETRRAWKPIWWITEDEDEILILLN